MAIRIGITGLIVLLILVMAVFTGYQVGTAAENKTELDREIQQIQTNYSETAENNLTANYSEYESDYIGVVPGVRTVDKALFYGIVKPVYWFGRSFLYGSADVIEGTARFSYNHL